MSTTECDVCCEKFNKSNRKNIVCVNNKCVFKSCRSCSEQYILQSVADAHCMSCKVAWDREFLTTQFTKKFASDDYKHHREKVLLEREKGLLPLTVPIAEHIKPYLAMKTKLEDNLQTVASELKELDTQLKAKTQEYEKHLQMKKATNPHYASITNYLFVDERILHENDCLDLEEKIAALKHRSNRMQNQKVLVCFGIERATDPRYAATDPMYVDENEKERRAFIRACPTTDCRGFLSTSWKCGLCNVCVCPDCHDIKTTAEHVCKQENLDTVALLKKDTRSCPKCAAQIFKINGCAQIWCTQCHTAFDFHTGKIETHIHNPHYYEYIRQHGGEVPRALGDNPCGEAGLIIDSYVMSRVIKTLGAAKTQVAIDLLAYRQIHAHINHVDIAQYTTDVIMDNQDLRIKYLFNEINEDQFKQLLQQREKKNDKKRAIHGILTMYQTVTIDILDAIHVAKTEADLRKVLQQMEQLRIYTNKSFEPISKRFSCVVPQITNAVVLTKLKI